MLWIERSRGLRPYKIAKRARNQSVFCCPMIARGAENLCSSTSRQNLPSFITDFNFYDSILYSDSICSINIIDFNLSDIGLCSLLCLSQYYGFLFRRSLGDDALRATPFFLSSTHSHENVNGIVFVLPYFRVSSEGTKSWNRNYSLSNDAFCKAL